MEEAPAVVLETEGVKVVVEARVVILAILVLSVNVTVEDFSVFDAFSLSLLKKT